MAKIFIDAGGHFGESVRRFGRIFHNADLYEIHTFEPNPKLWERFKDLPTTLHKKAVWIEDGHIDFFIAEQSDGSTVVQGKNTGNIDYGNPIEVESINLSEWIYRTFGREDHIVLKLDIEGAEYEVLNKMIEDATIEYVNEIYVEFHARKISTISRAKDAELLERLSHYDGLSVKRW